MNTLTNPRAIACHIVHLITQNKSSLTYLDVQLDRYSLSEQNRRLVYLLCYGIFRHFFYLNHVFDLHAQGKTKPKARILGLIGLYQILLMKKPLYASINESVSACDELNLTSAKPFINALLRRIKPDDVAKIKGFQELPSWLYGKLKKHYPDLLDQIVENSNLQPPIFLRLNRQKNYHLFIDTLEKNHIRCRTTDLENCMILQKTHDINTLPLFTEGFFSIQDYSAQLAAHILAPKQGEKILDACAAPGGKSTHLLELCPEIELTIMDNNAKRFQRIKENLLRLQLAHLNIHLSIHDASEKLNSELLFDKILIDAPCSATGVIRRNPDIKVLRTPDEVKEIAEVQKRILHNLAQHLKPRGLLLYATCSILPEENDKQIKTFLDVHSEFQPLEIPLFKENLKQSYGYQILPSQDGGDGFYYCLLQHSYTHRKSFY